MGEGGEDSAGGKGMQEDMVRVMGEDGRCIWQCTICGYGSKANSGGISNVKRHIIRKHAQKEQLFCPATVNGCKQKPLTNKYNYNEHLRIHHPEMYQIHKL